MNSKKLKFSIWQGKLSILIKLSLFVFFLSSINFIHAQQVAILKYEGGGDWYANPTALPNLIAFSNENINTKID
ncbi:MAG: hypothetical protein KAH72_09400, partial [Flavobacteriaceae bacterium]|nr:hypothetical protein [Flavobacteriaceae bacterium]